MWGSQKKPTETIMCDSHQIPKYVWRMTAIFVALTACRINANGEVTGRFLPERPIEKIGHHGELCQTKRNAGRTDF
jgi:hypothetical protein